MLHEPGDVGDVVGLGQAVAAPAVDADDQDVADAVLLGFGLGLNASNDQHTQQEQNDSFHNSQGFNIWQIYLKTRS